MSLEPFKLVGELVALVKNDDGEVIGEQSVGQVSLYALDFDKLPDRVAEIWPDVEKKFGA